MRAEPSARRQRPLPQRDGLIVGESFLAAPVSTALLGQGDALALPLADQGALELGKGPHDRQHEVGHGRVLAGEHQPLLQELDAHAALGQPLHQTAQIVEVARQAIHAVHHHGIAFADESEHGFQLRALGVLARGLVGEQLADLDLLKLAFRVLVVTADPNVTDALSLQDASIGWMGGRAYVGFWFHCALSLEFVRLESMTLASMCQRM